MKGSYFLLMLITVLFILPVRLVCQIPGLPAGWGFTLTPTSATFTIPPDVAFNNVDALQPGDWIGAFYEDDGILHCGGAIQWTGTGNLYIVLFGNDELEPVKNGFADDELIHWKFYYSSISEELYVNAYDVGFNQFFWQNGGLEQVFAFGYGYGCPIVVAGYDMTICEELSVTLQGYAENYISLLWYTPNGSGTFDNPTVLDAVYTPSAQDYLAGSVELCLIAYGMPPCPVVEDCMTISFCYHPSVYAGQDATIPCEPFLLEEAFAENCSAVQWTTNGDGVFTPSEYDLNPTYIPGEVDCANGSVELCLTGYPIMPCTIIAMDCITLNFGGLHLFKCMLSHDETLTNASAQEILQNMGNTIIEGSEYFSRITIETNQLLYETVQALPWITNMDTNFVFTTWNKGSKELIKANKVMAEPWSKLANPYQLTGEGVNLGIWDFGVPDPENLDFLGRLTVVETIENCYPPIPNKVHHATHVAGTMAGSGAYAPLYDYAGLAPKANIFGWYVQSGVNCQVVPDYPQNEMLKGVTNQGIVISQNSWGNAFITRNQYNQVIDWNCGIFGIYTSWCSDMDELVNNKNLSIFFAAGNDRQEANIYCGKSNYGTIVPLATSKNVVSVGAIDGNGNMSSFGLWGPCADGRLKPDVVAKGVLVYSSMPDGSSSGYMPANGTSMATPAVSGAAALMIERYRKIYGGETPRPDLLKNFILNTADDWGPVGPDFQSGYGVVNVEKAIQMIDEGSFMMSNVSHSDEITFPLHVCSDKLQVMLAWSDVEGWTNSNKNLINDLDLELENPDGTIYLPLTLDHNIPQALAVAGFNRRDNIEQVVIQNPMHGEWTIRVKGFDVPKNNPQNFSVTWIGGSIKATDAFMKDIPEDIGFEPNLLSDVMWTSPDILVRQNNLTPPLNLDFDRDHENAEYRDCTLFPESKNYVYVKVRNRGCNEVSGDVVLHWAKASPGLAWPAPWDGIPISGYPIMGGIIGTLPFVSLAGGDFTVLEFPWCPANPDDYFDDFGDDQNHFCLLARIISEDDPMTTPEIYGLYNNVRYNNNIAWKNIIVKDDLPGGKSLIVGNYSQTEMNCKISLDPVMAEGYNFFDYGYIKLKPTPPLYSKWEEGEFIGEGIIVEDSTILISSTEAWIGNLQFGPGELFGLSCEFITTSSFCNDDTITFRFDLSQIDVAAQGEKLLGGVTFRYQYLPMGLPPAYCPNNILVCITDEPFMLTGAIPTGGVYSGAGINEGIFDPLVAGIGEHFITYTITNEYGCPYSCGFMATVVPSPTVSAGEDMTINEGEFVQLNGIAENYEEIQWYTPDGTGMFDPPGNTLNPIYLPGMQDYINGSVTICLIASGIYPCEDAIDCMVLTFTSGPEVFAGDDALICAGENYQLHDATASEYSSLFWDKISGDGYFITPTILNPIYIPGPNDIATGSVELCLTAYPVGYSFIFAIDCMTLTINLQPETCCCPEFVLKDAVEICPPSDACSYECPANTKNDYYDGPSMAACKKITHTYTVYPNDPGLYNYSWEITGGTPLTYSGNPISILWGSGNRGFIKVIIEGEYCNDTIIQEICLVDGPEANFEFDPNPVCINSQVNFINTSIGGDTYHWDFGNGETSNAFNPPDQFYDTPGNYFIILSVTNNFYELVADSTELQIPCGCTDVISKTITVLDSVGPVIETDCCFGSVCPPGSSTFFTSEVCSNYVWGVTGGNITSGLNTNTITVDWDVIYPGVPNSVTLQLPWCASVPCPGTATLIVPVIYDNYPISGPDKICLGSSGTFSLPVWPGTYYTWTVTPDYYSYRYQFNKEDRNVADVNISFFNEGTYEVKCEYFNPMINCGGTTSFFVDVMPILSFIGVDEVCEGSTTYYYANGNVNWSVTPNSGININPSSGASTNITWGSPGEYVITATPVSPGDFCNDKSFKVINVVGKPVLGVIEGFTMVCPEKNQTYSITSNIEGSPFQWTIGTGAGIIHSLMGADNDSVVVQWSGSGSWQLKVRQLQQLLYDGCFSDWKVIDVIPFPAPTISGSNTVCVDDVTAYNASGPIPPGGFQWSIEPIGKATIISGNGTSSVNILWHGGGPTTGQVVVQHCGGSASMNVAVNDLPPAEVTLVINSPSGTDHPVFCQTDNFNISLSTPNCTGCSYQWFENGDIYPGTSHNITLTNFDFASPDKYKFHVEVTRNGCTARSSIVIIEIKNCEPGCPGECPGSGECLAYAWFWTYQDCDKVYLINKSEPSDFIATYQWSVTPSGTATISTPNARDAELTVTASGNYNIHLLITDVYGCTTSYSKFVDVLLPTADFTFSSPVCEGEPVFFSAIPNNPTLYDYYWTFGDYYTSNLAEPHHTFDPDNTNVTLTINDRYGCDAWFGLGLELNPVPVCEITTSGTHFCPGGFVTLTACSGMESYQWYKDYEPIAGATNAQLIVYQHGEYYVEVANEYGCTTNSESIYIFMHPTPVAKITGDTYVCSGNSFYLETLFKNNYSYNWSEVSDLSPGVTGQYIFSVLVTDNTTGCTAMDYVCVTINETPELSFVSQTTICEDNPITLSPNPNDPETYHYQWSNGQTDPEITVSTPGEYWLTITNKLTGCNATAYAATIYPKPDLSLFPYGCGTVLVGEQFDFYIPLPLNNNKWFRNTIARTYDSILWYDYNVLIGTNETYSFIATASNTGEHEISVKVKNYHDCENTAGVFCLNSSKDCPDACEIFDDGIHGFVSYNDDNGVITSPPIIVIESPGSEGYTGDLGMRVTDVAGGTWIYDTENFGGNYLACDETCLFWDMNVINNNTSYYPGINLFKGFNPSQPISTTNPKNPEYWVRFTSNNLTSLNMWAHTIAPVKPSVNGSPPTSGDGAWTWLNGNMPWNEFISDIQGIMFRVDITGWGSQAEKIRYDNICLGCSPCPRDTTICCDSTLLLSTPDFTDGVFSGTFVSLDGDNYEFKMGCENFPVPSPPDYESYSHDVDLIYTYTDPSGYSHDCHFTVTVDYNFPPPHDCPPLDTIVCLNGEPFWHGILYIDPLALGVGTHYFDCFWSNACGGWVWTSVTYPPTPNVRRKVRVVAPIAGGYSIPDVTVCQSDSPFWHWGQWIDPSEYEEGSANVIPYPPGYTDPCGTAVSGSYKIYVRYDTQCYWYEPVFPDGWLIISSPVNPVFPPFPPFPSPAPTPIIDIFEPEICLGHFEVALGKSGILWPTGSINTIGNWDVYQGYKIKMNAPGWIELTGEIPEDKTITLNAGANYIPVLSMEYYPAGDIFAQLGDDLIFAYDLHAQLLYWPQGGIYSLEVFEPGKGYLVGMSQPGQATYNPPSKSTIQNYVPAKPKVYENAPWSINKSGSTHLISINRSALDELEYGDYIGVFNNEGVCAGFTQYDDETGNLLLVANGKDFTAKANNGLAEDENMTFRIFNTATRTEKPVSVAYDASMPNTGTFVDNGLSMIIRIKTEPGLDGITIYPNPSKGIFNIVGYAGTAEIAVCNAFGIEVFRKSLKLPSSLDLSGQPNGIYLITIKTDKHIFFEKLVVN